MNRLQHELHKVLNRYLLDGLRDRKDMLAMQALSPLSRGYLPWSQAAMRPSAIAAVLNDIVINNRAYIVECGSGISTFYTGRLLKERGGRLFTIEHEEQWVALLQGLLAKEELSECVTVIHAPLEPSKHALDGGRWYDEEKLRCITGGGKVDLLIVDGPPAYSRELRHARYPAVPFFKDHLAADYTIVLDDINRRGEQEILEKWERELGIKFQRRFVDGTIGMGRPRHSFSV